VGRCPRPPQPRKKTTKRGTCRVSAFTGSLESFARENSPTFRTCSEMSCFLPGQQISSCRFRLCNALLANALKHSAQFVWLWCRVCFNG
jgi:hypothetical protein